MKNKPLLLIFLTIFFDILGYGILIPIVPYLFTKPDSPSFLLSGPSASTQYGLLLVGLLTAAYTIPQFFTNPLLGQLSDRFGRKRILSICLFGTALGNFVFGYAVTLKLLPLLFISRVLDGITGGNFVIAQAAIADVSKPEERAKNFGLIGAAFGLGFIIGPFLGGVLSDSSLVPWFSASLPFYFAGTLGLINTVWVIKSFPKTQTVFSKSKFDLAVSFRNILEAAKREKLKYWFLVNFLFFMGFGFYTAFVGVFYIKRFGFTESQIGLYFGYVGIWIAFSQGYIVGKVQGKFSERKILSLSLLVQAGCMILFTLATSSWMLFILTPFFAVGNALTFSNLAAIISKFAKPDEYGEVMGINSSVQSLGNIIPPLLGGVIAGANGYVIPLYVASVLILFGWILVKHAKSSLLPTPGLQTK